MHVQVREISVRIKCAQKPHINTNTDVSCGRRGQNFDLSLCVYEQRRRQQSANMRGLPKGTAHYLSDRGRGTAEISIHHPNFG